MNKPLFLTALLVGNAPAMAATDGYICEILEVREVIASGRQEVHSGIYKQIIGKTFSVNRATGEMIGSALSTAAYRSVDVINHGSAENGYSAVVISHPPHVSAKFIYVEEFAEQAKKPFVAVQRDLVFSGLCE